MAKMMKLTGLALVAVTAAGCSLRPYHGPDSVIATGQDFGIDSGKLNNGVAAIAYDPDGCQNWLIDDGIEGYSSPRFDPASGLPICNNHYPPGTVIGEYRSNHRGFPDYVPRRTGADTIVVRR